MNEYENEMIELEDKYSNLTYICKKGEVPVILTAVHTMRQVREDGSCKLSEPFTKALALYVAKKTSSFCLVKNKDTGIDPNRSDDDDFKSMLLDNIKDNAIKLVIDLHGASREREFNVEIGTLNNLTTDYATVNELIDAFNEQGIFLIEMNEHFKGGSITKKVYFETECDVLQIEINGWYRDLENSEKMKQVGDALINFINQYVEIIGR